MKVEDLRVGDRLRRNAKTIWCVTQIQPCGTCPCGWGEVFFDEHGPQGVRKRGLTFRQLERMRHLARLP